MITSQCITMTTREAKRYEVITDLLAKKIDQSQAASLLGLSTRQVKRIKVAVKLLSIQGVIHGNRGQPSNRRIEQDVIDSAIAHLRKDYHDFNPLLAQEKLKELNDITLSSEKVRQLMIFEKLWKPRKRKGEKKQHHWRERKDNYGEMQQFDGSYHNWFEGRNKEEVGTEQCLLLSVDDATGQITGAMFDYNEGVIAVMKFWKAYSQTHGLPVSIYLDKFSTYKVNHANAVDNSELITQFKRAIDQQLGVTLISAHSAQAKGRVEKMNGTLQRRLVKEMRLKNICTIEDANRFLKDVYIPQFNAQFAVVPKKDADLHRPLTDDQIQKLDSILSVHSERKVNNDYTVQFNNTCYQLDEIQPTTVYKKDTVIIEEHLNGDVKIAKNQHHLHYTILPERPKKVIEVKLAALTNRKQSTYIPPANHPWRRPLFMKKKVPQFIAS